LVQKTIAPPIPEIKQTFLLDGGEGSLRMERNTLQREASQQNKCIKVLTTYPWALGVGRGGGERGQEHVKKKMGSKPLQ